MLQSLDVLSWGEINRGLLDKVDVGVNVDVDVDEGRPEVGSSSWGQRRPLCAKVARRRLQKCKSCTASTLLHGKGAINANVALHLLYFTQIALIVLHLLYCTIQAAKVALHLFLILPFLQKCTTLHSTREPSLHLLYCNTELQWKSIKYVAQRCKLRLND